MDVKTLRCGKNERRDTRGGVSLRWLLILLLIPAGMTAQTFTDDVGRQVEISTPAGNIVCLSPAHTEMFFDMGLEGHLAAVSAHCDYPAAAKKMKKAGTFMSPDVEMITYLKPSVVISGGGVQKKAIAKLEELGVAVIVLYPRNHEDIKNNMKKISRICGADEKGAKAAARFEKKMKKALVTRGKKRKVYMEIWNSPLMTAGGSSFLGQAVETAGGGNLFADSASEYPKVSPEEVIKRNPEVVVLLYSPEDDYAQRVYIKNTISGKNGNVFIYHDADILLRPGPRYAEGVGQLSKIIGNAK